MKSIVLKMKSISIGIYGAPLNVAAGTARKVCWVLPESGETLQQRRYHDSRWALNAKACCAGILRKGIPSDAPSAQIHTL
ncbi:hypothetical protein [Nitratireductor sp. ZSWI3]|uniref:hypothetical protein n=1 Tax=Nitratireductor sp. ZSWI3 TaxID=2966359 RepID=UPI00215006B5|nr:hypothetical protein [Nitratireductor sp. ZSWI3]MCR4269322.1 hypothetical protein [Nitratireductor sp. ZSWI3]